MSLTALSILIERDPRPCARPKVVQRGKAKVAIKADEDVEAQAQVAAAWQDALAPLAADAWPHEPERAYSVNLSFDRATFRRADADNLIKTVLDGLNGLAWHDDSQVVRGTWDVTYRARLDGVPPGTLVTVRRLPRSWRGSPLPLEGATPTAAPED